MKKRLFFLLFCLCSYNTLHAQLPVIAVQNDDAPQFFTVLEEAIDYAEDGDTLYLPGGSFLLMSEIDKELHFVGAGHYPDSASGGIITKIIGIVYLTSGADSCSFEGLYLDAIILANGSGYTNFISLSGLDIIRCSFDGITLGGSYSNANNDDNNVRNIYITECVLRNEIQGKNAKSVLLEKNIFTAPIRNFNGSVTISHCIFLSSNAIVSCSGLMVNNSIFHSDDYVYSYTENCTFNNNVFVYDFSSGTNSHTFNNNITSVDADVIFEKADASTFDYTQNYMLKVGSPAIGIGLGGKDAGIYGHDNPYSNGITSYPFIELIEIPNSTDASGNLNIQVKVSARDY